MRVETRLQNKNDRGKQNALIMVDYEINLDKVDNVKRAIGELNLFCRTVQEKQVPEVPWFPSSPQDIDHIKV